MTPAEEICRHLKLNPRAGLGWRLCRAQVERSRRSPGRYTITAANDVETALLVRALSVRAAMVSSLPLRFEGTLPPSLPDAQGFHFLLQLSLQQPVHLPAHSIPLPGFAPV